jgi:hypothetical protein
MAEHTHAKDLSFSERSDALLYRSNINQIVNRFHLAYEKFRRSHNSGYCAFELQKDLEVVAEEFRLLNQLLTELGKIEHYNYEAILATSYAQEV